MNSSLTICVLCVHYASIKHLENGKNLWLTAGKDIIGIFGPKFIICILSTTSSAWYCPKLSTFLSRLEN